MTNLQSIQNANLRYSGLLRDGGSAVLIAQSGDKKIKLRIMRSIAERTGDLFNRIEISIDDTITQIVQSGTDVDGLNLFISKNKTNLDPRVLEAFSATLPSSGDMLSP